MDQKVHKELWGVDQMASKILFDSSTKRLCLCCVLKDGLDLDRIIVEEHSSGGHHIRNKDSSSGE